MLKLGIIFALACLAAFASANRTKFDHGWKFHLGDASDPAKDFNFLNGSFSAFAKAGTNDGPISLGQNDDDWRTVDLPHDWAVELPFDKTADLMHGYKPVGRQFPDTSVGWYRKHFNVPTDAEGKRIRVTFDGIFRNAEFFLNGHYLGTNESGYIGTTLDLTDYVKYGSENVLVVRVDASAMEGWFYEGAGIYRHVWYSVTDPVYMAQDGVKVVPVLGSTSEVNVNALIVNKSDKSVTQRVSVTLLDADGKQVAETRGTPREIAADSENTLSTKLFLDANPHPWSPEDPYLYTVVAKTETDQYTCKVGFRNFKFDVERGFLLNGKPYRIQGVCCHQDHAGVGAAVPDAVNYWRMEQLKKYGVNFLRTSHNPPTPELLDACDELGIMVLDETRMFGSTGEALSQWKRLIQRDRNHASVIFWSVGNEEWGTHGTPESARIATTMMEEAKKLDSTRPFTYAGNNGAQLTGINSVVDIRGFNYQLQGIEEYHKARPDQPIHGSETASTVTTRGEYVDDPVKGYKNAYDLKGVDWGSSAEGWWPLAIKYPWFEGGFVWTGFDYRGEPTPYAWPNINSHFGILDTCGFPKDVAFYYKAWWGKDPVLHIFPHWNWAGKEGQDIDVWVFANHQEVELFLNGRSLGKKAMPVGGHVEWKVPYQSGKLSAVAYDGGIKTQEAEVETAGRPVTLKAQTETKTLKADGDDAAVINIQSLDSQNVPVPGSSELVTFKVEGPARIIGVGNGDPSCHEPDVVLPTRPYVPVRNWKWKQVDGDPKNRHEVEPSFDDSGWADGRIGTYELFKQGDIGVYRAHFNVEDPAKFTKVSVGPVDDLGWVYINGKLVGTADKWDQAFSFDVKSALKSGDNVIAIVVQNNGGSGGLIGGASLTGDEIPGVWTRSLFHGLAQVIIRSTGQPGEITVTASTPGLSVAKVEITSK